MKSYFLHAIAVIFFSCTLKNGTSFCPEQQCPKDKSDMFLTGPCICRCYFGFSGDNCASVQSNNQFTYDDKGVPFMPQISGYGPMCLGLSTPLTQVAMTCRLSTENPGAVALISNPSQTDMTITQDFGQMKGCFGGGPGNVAISTVNAAEMLPYILYTSNVWQLTKIIMGLYCYEVGNPTKHRLLQEVTVNIGYAPNPVGAIVCVSGPCSSSNSISIATGQVFQFAFACVQFCSNRQYSVHYNINLQNATATGSAANIICTDAQSKQGCYLGGNDDRPVFITPGVLQGGTYNLVGTAWIGSNVISLSQSITTFAGPSGGQCMLSPGTGISISTFFNLSCTGWTDFAQKSNTLSFYYYQIVDSRQVLLNTGSSNNSVVQVTLISGDPTNYYSVSIMATVVDAIGGKRTVNLTAKVAPPDAQNFNMIVTDTASSDSILSKAILTGDTTLAVKEVEGLAVLASSNSSFDATSMAQLYNTLATAFSNITVRSLKDVSLVAGAATALLSASTKINTTQLGGIANKFEDMTSVFVNTADQIKLLSTSDRATISTGLIGPLVATMISCTNRLNSDDRPNVTTSDTEKQTMEAASRGLVSSLNSVLMTLSAVSRVGDPPVVIQDASVTFAVATQSAAAASDVSINASFGAIDLPTEVFQGFGSCLQSTVGLIATNPYVWDKSAENITTGVARVLINSCGGTGRRKRTTLPNPFSVELKNAQTLPHRYSINEVLMYQTGLIYHSIVLSQHSTVQISVYPQTGETLSVYVGFDKKPNQTNFQVKLQSPRTKTTAGSAGGGNDYLFTTFINATTLNNSKVLYIGVGKLACTDTGTLICTKTNLSYQYVLAALQCNVWNPVTNVWENSNCLISSESTSSLIRAKSSVLGQIAATLIVAPNTIDFSTVFNDFGAKLVKNFIVVGTIVIVDVLFIVIILFCRQLDKRDHIKWQLLPLVDNNPKDTHEYEIYVHTGELIGAETESRVFMYMKGTKATSRTFELHDGMRKHFRRDSVDGFILLCHEYLGDLHTVYIWHNNTGVGLEANWFLSKVVVVDIGPGSWYLFSSDKWLKDSTHLRLTCAHNLMTRKDFSRKVLMIRNLQVMLQEIHIWFSTTFRKVRSTFTRVQRLSVCMSILMLNMLFSAMWFNVGDINNDSAAMSAVQMGLAIQISVSSFVVSVYCTLITTAIVTPMTYLFAKSGKSHYEKQREFVRADAITWRRQIGRLPHNCIYLAYFLVFSCLFLSAFFCILYALQWGPRVSRIWLGSFLMSFLESVFVIEPLKVFAFVVALTLIFGKDSSLDAYTEVYGPLKNTVVPLEDDDDTKKNKPKKKKKKCSIAAPKAEPTVIKAGLSNTSKQVTSRSALVVNEQGPARSAKDVQQPAEEVLRDTSKELRKPHESWLNLTTKKKVEQLLHKSPTTN